MSDTENPVNTVRAKFRVDSVLDTGSQQFVKLSAFTSGVGNENWSKYTPSGSMEMNITNPDASAFFKPGKEVFIDFSHA